MTIKIEQNTVWKKIQHDGDVIVEMAVEEIEIETSTRDCVEYKVPKEIYLDDDYNYTQEGTLAKIRTKRSNIHIKA